MSYDESDAMFVFGLGFGAIFGGLVSAMLVFGALNGNAENEYKQLLQDAGIRLERHYTETDGVRTNWVDVIFINKEEKK